MPVHAIPGRRPLIPLLLLFLSGCLPYQEVTLKQVNSIELTSFTDAGVSVRVQAVIDNQNNYRIRVTTPDVMVYLNNEPMGKARFDSTLVLDPRVERSYCVPVSTALDGTSGLWLGGLGALLAGEARIRISGTVKGRVGLVSRRIPFELEQVVPFHE